ncbi:MAG: FtsX-like permease family protein [Bacteroidota bacterium]
MGALPNGDITYVRILLLIGIFILAIACINYINLVTARSAQRAKEVGIRKAIGAVRGQLVKQFLTESTITVFASLALALVILFAVLPLPRSYHRNGFVIASFQKPGRDLEHSLCFDDIIDCRTYPALYLSGFQPLKTLRGSLIAGQQGSSLRKALVVFQFTMSSALIAGTLIIATQLDFMKGKSLGFNKDNVLLVPNVRGGIGIETRKGSWDEEVRQLPGVVSIARADGILGSNNSVNGVGYAPANSQISLNFIRIDYDFIPTLEIQLAAGRNFSRDFISDTTAIIINEEAVKQLGLTEPILGKRLAWDDDAGITHDVTIVGVAKDFHFTDLHTAIRPFGFILEVNNGSNFFIRTASSDLERTLGGISGVLEHFQSR